MKNKEILNTLKQNPKIDSLTKGMIAGHMCRPLAYRLSVIFINKNINPNTITLLMIISGVIGSIFFALPNIWLKIIGYFFYYLWFTFDLSDGQVARYAKRFSKYGTEMDYMAHLICHPCMNLALFLTYYQIFPDKLFLLSLIFIIFISIELYTRNTVAFDYYWSKLSQLKQLNTLEKISKHKYLNYFISEGRLYPNFILVFTPIVIIGYILQKYNNCFTSYVLYLLIAYVIFIIFNFIITLFIRLKKYYLDVMN